MKNQNPHGDRRNRGDLDRSTITCSPNRGRSAVPRIRTGPYKLRKRSKIRLASLGSFSLTSFSLRTYTKILTPERLLAIDPTTVENVEIEPAREIQSRRFGFS
jgi:hypothetical protein